MKSQILLALTALTLTACTQAAGERVLQTKFTPANADFSPITKITVQTAKTSYFQPSVMGEKDYNTLLEAAYKQVPPANNGKPCKLASQTNDNKGCAYALIDMIITTEVTTYFPLPIYSTKYILEATAISLDQWGLQKPVGGY